MRWKHYWTELSFITWKRAAAIMEKTATKPYRKNALQSESEDSVCCAFFSYRLKNQLTGNGTARISRKGRPAPKRGRRPEEGGCTMSQRSFL